MNFFRILQPSASLGALAAVALLLQTAANAAPLPRANIILASVISIDAAAGTAVLPLHHGTAGGRSVWYIVTDSSDRADAQRRRVNFAPLLAQVGAGCAACLHVAKETPAGIAFPAAPDFGPKRSYIASATGFPPRSAAPGAIAAVPYTPFLQIGAAIVNAPIVAVGDGPFDVANHTQTHDRVVAIDTAKHTVTLALAQGFFDGKRVAYVSTEASDPGAATVERATYVPALKAKSGTVPIDVVVNGSHQGLRFVALHGNLERDAQAANAAQLGSALNVLSTFAAGPTAAAYSPLWGVTLVSWKSTAAGTGHDVILRSTADVSRATSGPDGRALGPAGFVVNCPVLAYVDRP